MNPSQSKRIASLIVLAMVVLIGCATRYQQRGLSGGYTDSRIDANTFHVVFNGNGYTSRQTIEKYLLYRCAEVTVEAGYDFFVIVGGGVESKKNTFTTTTPGQYSSQTTGFATAYGNMATGSAMTTGTYTPPQTTTNTVTKHVGAFWIKGFNGEKPADNPNAYDAREVIKYLGPAIK